MRPTPFIENVCKMPSNFKSKKTFKTFCQIMSKKLENPAKLFQRYLKVWFKDSYSLVNYFPIIANQIECVSQANFY